MLDVQEMGAQSFGLGCPGNTLLLEKSVMSHHEMEKMPPAQLAQLHTF